jgi:hypothetical protein
MHVSLQFILAVFARSFLHLVNMKMRVFPFKSHCRVDHFRVNNNCIAHKHTRAYFNDLSTGPAKQAARRLMTTQCEL